MRSDSILGFPVDRKKQAAASEVATARKGPEQNVLPQYDLVVLQASQVVWTSLAEESLLAPLFAELNGGEVVSVDVFLVGCLLGRTCFVGDIEIS